MSAHMISMNLYLTYALLLVAAAAVVVLIVRSSTTIRSSTLAPARHWKTGR